MSSSRLLDLPEDLTNSILNRLPLPDYVRFASVCRQCKENQVAHRRLYAPSYPPLPHIPWLIQHDRVFRRQINIFNTGDRRFYNFDIPESGCRHRPIVLTEGWIIMAGILSRSHRRKPVVNRYQPMSLFNPITGVGFQLPTLLGGNEADIAAMSSPPTVAANCFVMVVSENHIFTCLVGDLKWTVQSTAFSDIKSVVFSRGSFYCLVLGGIVVVDPTINEARFLKMNTIHSSISRESLRRFFLVEFRRKVMLVIEVSTSVVRTYEADTERGRWVEDTSIGGGNDYDAVLLNRGGFSGFIRATAKNGYRRNCIFADPSLINMTVNGSPSTYVDILILDLANGRSKHSLRQGGMAIIEGNQFQNSYAMDWFCPRLKEVAKE